MSKVKSYTSKNVTFAKRKRCFKLAISRSGFVCLMPIFTYGNQESWIDKILIFLKNEYSKYLRRIRDLEKQSWEQGFWDYFHDITQPCIGIASDWLRGLSRGQNS